VELRHRHGALSLETIEAKAVFAGDVLYDLELDRKNRAKQLIEDFMIAAKGTWVRLFQPPAEGRLERGFQGLDVGDRVHVKLVHTDIERGFIDFVRD
jgi:hypothetical protein